MLDDLVETRRVSFHVVTRLSVANGQWHFGVFTQWVQPKFICKLFSYL